MITINFYNYIENKLHFICKIIKYMQKFKYKIIIFSKNSNELQNINKLLWTFSKEDFFPHVYINDKLSNNTPILLTNNKNYNFKKYNILINLSYKILPFFKNFQKILEIISNEKTDKFYAKKKYFIYKKKGYVIKFFNFK